MLQAMESEDAFLPVLIKGRNPALLVLSDGSAPKEADTRIFGSRLRALVVKAFLKGLELGAEVYDEDGPRSMAMADVDAARSLAPAFEDAGRSQTGTH